jgi:hypothetical protein
VYKGFAYNLNEFGNLLFGSVKAKLGVNLTKLNFGGWVYSIFSNGSADEESEKKAVERGYEYGK